MAFANRDFSKKNVLYNGQGTEKFELRNQMAACLRQGMEKRKPVSIHLSTSNF